MSDNKTFKIRENKFSTLYHLQDEIANYIAYVSTKRNEQLQKMENIEDMHRSVVIENSHLRKRIKELERQLHSSNDTKEKMQILFRRTFSLNGIQ